MLLRACWLLILYFYVYIVLISTFTHLSYVHVKYLRPTRILFVNSAGQTTGGLNCWRGLKLSQTFLGGMSNFA